MDDELQYGDGRGVRGVKRSGVGVGAGAVPGSATRVGGEEMSEMEGKSLQYGGEKRRESWEQRRTSWRSY